MRHLYERELQSSVINEELTAFVLLYSKLSLNCSSVWLLSNNDSIIRIAEICEVPT